MPNQRGKDKVRLGGFLERDLRREVVALAKREGMENNIFGFAMKLDAEALAHRRKLAQRRRAAKRRGRLYKDRRA